MANHSQLWFSHESSVKYGNHKLWRSKFRITGTSSKMSSAPCAWSLTNQYTLSQSVACAIWFLKKLSSHDTRLDICMKHGQRNKEEMPSSTSWVSSYVQAHVNSDFVSIQQAQFFLSRRGRQNYMKWPNSMHLCSSINIKVLLWFPDSFSQQRCAVKAVLTSSWLASPADHMSGNMIRQNAPSPLH